MRLHGQRSVPCPGRRRRVSLGSRCLAGSSNSIGWPALAHGRPPQPIAGASPEAATPRQAGIFPHSSQSGDHEAQMRLVKLTRFRGHPTI
jgi:hypothetical protein